MPSDKGELAVETGLSEDHFTRLARVPRATRQDWALARLVGAQRTPYSLDALYEVIVFARLRESLKGSADVAWSQLHPSLMAAANNEAVELVVDLHLLSAAWVRDDTTIANVARAGHDVRVIDLTLTLREARTGFDLAVAATQAPDQLAARRTDRAKRRAED
ncbi:MAG: hypothetical protein ACR2NB_08470 [Solirubrobacteraceae bacterium]